jgi:AraC-like DNA-binding protein
MDYQDLPAFMHKLGAISTQSARALEVMILTLARTAEVQNMRWAQLDYVSVVYEKPAHAGVYDELFACPVLFGQRTNTFGYDPSAADGAVTLADPRSHAMAREMCEQVLAEVNRGGGAAAEVRRPLIERPGHYPNIELIAEELSIHPRALRRRLEAEGTSYRDILAEVRRCLAMEYLRKTHMTNEEIASRLGYSDAANFRHAFLRWTGKSPSDLRLSANAF